MSFREKNEMAGRFVAGGADRVQVILDRPHGRIGLAPEIGNLGRAVFYQPGDLRRGHPAARPEEPAPAPEAVVEAHLVDRSLGPDEIERGIVERKLEHRGVDGPDALGQAGPGGPEAEIVQERRVIVDGRHRAAAQSGQGQGLGARTAADIEDIGPGRKLPDDVEGPGHRRVVAGPLAGQAAVDLEKDIRHEKINGGEGGIRTRGPGLSQGKRLAGVPDRPLQHLSAVGEPGYSSMRGVPKPN